MSATRTAGAVLAGGLAIANGPPRAPDPAPVPPTLGLRVTRLQRVLYELDLGAVYDALHGTDRAAALAQLRQLRQACSDLAADLEAL